MLHPSKLIWNMKIKAAKFDFCGVLLLPVQVASPKNPPWPAAMSSQTEVSSVQFLHFEQRGKITSDTKNLSLQKIWKQKLEQQTTSNI